MDVARVIDGLMSRLKRTEAERDTLRALVSRARELAAKIGEADGITRELRPKLQILREGGDFDAFKGDFIKFKEAALELCDARRELLAMFAEGK